ncbi:MAG TPA: hypothetical protein VJT75_08295 [Thermoleophilaceae bacterium]|nr:hypothetical protein [Thermoleophilaceae bacterium]
MSTPADQCLTFGWYDSLERSDALLAVVVSATALAVTAAPAVTSAAINVGPGNGNPQTNSSGKCPGGQNETTSPGGIKKC